MKRIYIIITLLLFLVSCGNKTYYENDKKVAKLLCIENGIAKIKYYDDVNEREEIFVKRMKKILKFYNIENNIFELYSSALLDYYKMDIKDIDPDELLIVNNTLVEEEITTDEYRKYETTDFLSNEEIMKVCDSNRGTPNERDVIRFYHQKGYTSYAYAHKRNNNSYNIFWPEKDKKYSAEYIENEWVIKENQNTIAVEEKIESPTVRKKTVDPLVGSYKCDKSKDVYVFHADGTGEFFAMGSTSSSSFTWNRFVDDVTILYKVYGEQKLKFNLSNKTITEKSASLGTLVFRKIN